MEVRRIIENRLFNNDLLVVTCTNALELGINLGHLDCTIQVYLFLHQVGFPGCISSFWQQIGRSGRSDKEESVAIYCASQSPIDQFFMSNPNELLNLQPENGVIDISNEVNQIVKQFILSQHILKASYENPISIDEAIFGEK